MVFLFTGFTGFIVQGDQSPTSRRARAQAEQHRGPDPGTRRAGDVAFDRRLGSSLGGSGGMTDSYYSGNVSGQFAGLASASADGAVRPWCPDGGGAPGGGARRWRTRTPRASSRWRGVHPERILLLLEEFFRRRSFFFRAFISRRKFAHRGGRRELRAVAGRGAVPAARAEQPYGWSTDRVVREVPTRRGIESARRRRGVDAGEDAPQGVAISRRGWFAPSTLRGRVRWWLGRGTAW